MYTGLDLNKHVIWSVDEDGDIELDSSRLESINDYHFLTENDLTEMLEAIREFKGK